MLNGFDTRSREALKSIFTIENIDINVGTAKHFQNASIFSIDVVFILENIFNSLIKIKLIFTITFQSPNGDPLHWEKMLMGPSAWDMGPGDSRAPLKLFHIKNTFLGPSCGLFYIKKSSA